MQITLDVVSHLSYVESIIEVGLSYSTFIISLVSLEMGYEIFVPKDFDVSNVDALINHIVNLISNEKNNRYIKFIVEDSDKSEEWRRSIIRFSTSTKSLLDLYKEEEARMLAKL